METLNLEIFSVPVIAYDENERICGENHLALEITKGVSSIGKPLLLFTEEYSFSYKFHLLLKQNGISVIELLAEDSRHIDGIMQIEHELITPLDRMRSHLYKLKIPDEEQAFFDKIFLTLRKRIQSITFEMRFRDGDIQLYSLPGCDLSELLTNLSIAVNDYYDCEIIKLDLNDRHIQADYDENKLLHALLQLINNAIKMTPEGTTPSVSLTLSEEEKNVIITISDNGIGFPEEKIGSLTESYVQGANSLTDAIPGLGIGLYLVNKIVSLHDGKLELSNNTQGGAQVKISLPQSKTRKNGMLKTPRSLFGLEEIKDRVAFMLVDVTI